MEVLSIQNLAEKCFEEGRWHPFWVEWRGIFEYVACIEYSYESIENLPKGIELLNNFAEVQARYHIASLVFFAKATLDIISEWLNEKYSLKLRGSFISLSKKRFQNELVTAESAYLNLFEDHIDFLEELEVYRQNWIHRVVGGAMIGGDKRPGDPDFTDANIGILIPMDSSLNFHSVNYKEQHIKIEELERKNSGKHLYNAEEFSDYILYGTKLLIFDIIELILPLFDEDE